MTMNSGFLFAGFFSLWFCGFFAIPIGFGCFGWWLFGDSVDYINHKPFNPSLSVYYSPSANVSSCMFKQFHLRNCLGT